MSKTNPEVDAFIARAGRWQQEMEALRAIALDSQLTEEIKWGKPCYTHQDSNIAIIQPFKDSIAFMFFKGVLLKDPEGILEAPGENSRTARRIPFTGLQEITDRESVLKDYIQEAVEVEEAGLQPELGEEPELEFPMEFQKAYDEDPDLKAAFDALTPGRQRVYIMHFSQAKQAKTRQSRVEKSIPLILEGKGLNDR